MSNHSRKLFATKHFSSTHLLSPCLCFCLVGFFPTTGNCIYFIHTVSPPFTESRKMLLQHQKTGNVCCTWVAFLLVRVDLHFPLLFFPQNDSVCALFEQVMTMEVSAKWVCWPLLSSGELKGLCEMRQAEIMFLRTYKPEKEEAFINCSWKGALSVCDGVLKTTSFLNFV